MLTLSADDFKKKYGTLAVSQFNSKENGTDNESNIFSEIKNAFSGGLAKIGQGIQEANPTGPGGVEGLVSGVGKIAGGAAEAITSPTAPVINRTLGAAVNYVGDKISNIPAVQKFAQTPLGQKVSKVAGTVADYANAAGTVAGLAGGGAAAGKAAKAAPEAIGRATESLSIPDLGGVKSQVGSAIRDITPTLQGTIDHNLAKALDLTPGDLSRIEKSTGNPVGPWLAQNDLIGTNKANTVNMVRGFFDTNYKNVRSAIDAVKTEYKPSQIPRLTDALKQLQKQVQDVPGLEQKAADIDNLLHKETYKLSDVQKVKELIDEQYRLYSKSGDVMAGTVSQGLANIRRGVKDFIEQKVQEDSGQDIRQMNNSVATARDLIDSIEQRSTRGLTRANLTTRDVMMGLGLYAFVNPVVGIAAVFTKKLVTSPTFRLRLARYLDQISDKEKASINQTLQEGELPKQLETFTNQTE